MSFIRNYKLVIPITLLLLAAAGALIFLGLGGDEQSEKPTDQKPPENNNETDSGPYPVEVFSDSPAGDYIPGETIELVVSITLTGGVNLAGSNALANFIQSDQTLDLELGNSYLIFDEIEGRAIFKDFVFRKKVHGCTDDVPPSTCWGYISQDLLFSYTVTKEDKAETLSVRELVLGENDYLRAADGSDFIPEVSQQLDVRTFVATSLDIESEQKGRYFKVEINEHSGYNYNYTEHISYISGKQNVCDRSLDTLIEDAGNIYWLSPNSQSIDLAEEEGTYLCFQISNTIQIDNPDSLEDIYKSFKPERYDSFPIETVVYPITYKQGRASVLADFKRDDTAAADQYGWSYTLVHDLSILSNDCSPFMEADSFKTYSPGQVLDFGPDNHGYKVCFRITGSNNDQSIEEYLPSEMMHFPR